MTTAVIFTPLLSVPRIATPWHSPALTILVLPLFGLVMPVSATGNKLLSFLLWTLLVALSLRFALTSSQEVPGASPQNLLTLPLVNRITIFLFLFNWVPFYLDIPWVRGPSPADIKQYAGEMMALGFLWFMARNPHCNVTTAPTQLTSLIGDTSASLQCDHQLLDTLKHAHAELLATAASIAGGSEDEE